MAISALTALEQWCAVEQGVRLHEPSALIGAHQLLGLRWFRLDSDRPGRDARPHASEVCARISDDSPSFECPEDVYKYRTAMASVGWRRRDATNLYLETHGLLSPNG